MAKITFLEDHQSVHSGNEFYRAGDKADLRGWDELLKRGVVRAGWGPVEEPEEAEEDPAWPEYLTQNQIDALDEAGYTPASVTQSTVTELTALSGIGIATAKKLISGE